MKTIRKLLAAALALCLCAWLSGALAAGLDHPEDYLGAWEGGEDYGETSEYYLELTDFKDGVYTASLSVYRIWSFDSMTAILTQDAPAAVLATAADDVYVVLATLDFGEAGIDLTVLESDSPDLPAETVIAFRKCD